MEHLDLAFRFAPSESSAEFSGHAVIWGERNRHNEIVQRGAFAKTLAAHRVAGTKPVMLWAHNPAEIIGVWDEVREDETGLFVRGRLLTDVTAGRDAHERIKAGAVNGLSIGWSKSPSGMQRRGGVIHISEIGYLAEISVVGMPSAGGARITSVRNSGRSTESAAAFVSACAKARTALSKRN